MTNNTKRRIRDYIRLFLSVLWGWLYIPHLLLYAVCRERRAIINSDTARLKQQINFDLPTPLAVLFFLHNSDYYRSSFYYRIGPILSLLIGWWRKGNKSFIIPDSTKVGKGLYYAHPYSTVLNAESIGDNFTCIHCTTIGKKNGKRPVIGNNVCVGAHACIIGDIHVGDNVIVGAGSVVVKDVPDNCVVAGNPARIIRYLSSPNDA